MYSDFLPILTGACAAAALMLIEHMVARHLDFRVRYVLGMLAFLAGYAVWAWRTGQWGSWRAAVAIGGSGFIVIVAHALRRVWTQEITSARESGRIEGRVEEANRGATGIARTRRD